VNVRRFIWILACVLLAGGTITIFGPIAQFIPERNNPLASIVLASSPRFNAQTIALNANSTTRVPFLVAPGFKSFVGIRSKEDIQIGVFRPNGAQIIDSATAFKYEEKTEGDVKKKTLNFTNNLEAGMWELEISAANPGTVVITSGNSVPGGTSISLAVQNHTPELNDQSLVIVEATNFVSATTKLEVETLKEGDKTAIPVTVADDGTAPDEKANDGRFTGRLLTNEKANFLVAAIISRKTRIGTFVRTQTQTETYTVYEKSAHIIDNPVTRLTYHPVYGIPTGIELEFDFQVFKPGRYGISAGIGGESPGQEANGLGFQNFESETSNDSNTSNRPFYNAGVHRVILRNGIGPGLDVAGSAPIRFNTWDAGNSRPLDTFTSKTRMVFSKDQLFPKRFQSFDGYRLVDTNGDGDPDAIEVKFTASVYKAGNYLWSAFIGLSKDTQVATSDRGYTVSADGTGPLGTFDITPVLVIPGGTDTVELPEEPEVVFKSNYYDLTLGQAEPAKTVASLVQIIRDSKTVRPVDGIKAEMIAKLEEAEAFAKAGKNVEAYESMVNDFGDLLRTSEKVFSPRSLQLIDSTWGHIYDKYEARVQ
jgi:hypothetical protein